MRLVLVLLTVIVTTCLYLPVATAASVKVAAIHFRPDLGDVPGNRARLLALNEAAAAKGAKIIVNTEMATSGYAFFSRAGLAKVAETIPGTTTQAFGELAKRYEVYIVVGLPEFDPTTHQYFNTAVLIGPDGLVAGSYRKRNSLLESSYNAIASGPVPTFETPYGKVAIVICADLFYPHFVRLAALAGAQIILAPANTGVQADFIGLRARENNVAIIVANRYGAETQGAPVDVFNEDTFTISSPFAYDFSWGSLSAIVGPEGKVVGTWGDPADDVLIGDISPSEDLSFPVVRRPGLYGVLNQDTLEAYTFTQFDLPKAAVTNVAALDTGTTDDLEGLTARIEDATAQSKASGSPLGLVVLQLGAFTTEDPATVEALAQLAERTGADLVVPFGGAKPDDPGVSMLFAVEDGEAIQYRYKRTHRLANEAIVPGDDFLVVDRPYGRLALLQGADLMAPETTMVMAKLGVDVVAVSDNSATDTATLWRTRSADYLHLVVANADGDEGVFLGGYQAQPQERIAEGLVVLAEDSGQVRNKKEPRHVDATPMLLECGLSTC